MNTAQHNNAPGQSNGAGKQGLSRTGLIASWACQILAAVILGQTLFFKFTGAEEPVYIFTKLGAEPWGRIGSGVAELIAVILLLIPRTALFGAILSIGVITGAIGAHLGPLGIVVKDDHGLLFGLAIVVLVCSVVVVFLRRQELRTLIARVLGRK